MKNELRRVKPCGHKWECGCGKSLCENCLSQDSDRDYCEDETCPSYYLHRNDNCDCCGTDCGFCKTNIYKVAPRITCPFCQSQEVDFVRYMGEGSWILNCYSCAERARGHMPA